jgi:hypothetical protein
MQSFLLDLYPRGPLQATGYVPGMDPRRVVRWFDADSHFVEAWEAHLFFNHRSPTLCFLGGVRHRVLDVNPCLTKFPLVRFHDRMLLHLGLHEIEGARVSDIRGASLHCKFLQDFAENAVAEAAREQHWNAAYEYKRYAARVRENPELSLWTPGSIGWASWPARPSSTQPRAAPCSIHAPWGWWLMPASSTRRGARA